MPDHQGCTIAGAPAGQVLGAPFCPLLLCSRLDGFEATSELISSESSFFPFPLRPQIEPEEVAYAHRAQDTHTPSNEHEVAGVPFSKADIPPAHAEMRISPCTKVRPREHQSGYRPGGEERQHYQGPKGLQVTLFHGDERQDRGNTASVTREGPRLA